MKKTNIPIYIMYLWAALVLAACTGDDDAAWPEGGVPLELYAAVEGYSSANAQTRATTENRWEGGEVVRLWIKSSISSVPNQEIYLFVDSDGKLIQMMSPAPGEARMRKRRLMGNIIRWILLLSLYRPTREIKDIRIATAWLLPTSTSP